MRSGYYGDFIPLPGILVSQVFGPLGVELPCRHRDMFGDRLSRYRLAYPFCTLGGSRTLLFRRRPVRRGCQRFYTNHFAFLNP